jgi:Bacteriophage minor capsid protein
MADRISFALYDAATGAPLTGATPAFVQYRDILGNARTPPAITELGAGQYGFSPTDADELARVAYLLDAGASAEPRRYSGAIHTPRAPFLVWHLETGAGALWSGGAPSFGLYDDFQGNARTPPSIITPGATTYLFAAVPSTADLELDVAFRVDSPTGAEPPFVTGSLEAQPWVAPSPGPLKDAAADIAAFLDGKAAGASTLTLATNLFAGKMPNQDKVPTHPCVACLNTGGPESEHYVNAHRTGLYRPSVQVTVRGPAGDDEAGELVARETLAWVNMQVTAGYITWNVRESQPTFLGTDHDQHGLWSFNVECLYRVSLD